MATIIANALMQLAVNIMQAFGFGIVIALMLALFAIAALASAYKQQ